MPHEKIFRTFACVSCAIFVLCACRPGQFCGGGDPPAAQRPGISFAGTSGESVHFQVRAQFYVGISSRAV